MSIEKNDSKKFEIDLKSIWEQRKARFVEYGGRLFSKEEALRLLQESLESKRVKISRFSGKSNDLEKGKYFFIVGTENSFNLNHMTADEIGKLLYTIYEVPINTEVYHWYNRKTKVDIKKIIQDNIDYIKRYGHIDSHEGCILG